MSNLAEPLRKMVEPGHNYQAWYLFPPPAGRKPSVIYKYALDSERSLENRHRNHIEKMVKKFAEDESAGGDPKYHGVYSDEDWARILECDLQTVKKYRREIKDVFFNANLDPHKEIFEEVTHNGWSGVRIRPEVVIVRPKPAIQSRRRRRRPRPR
jgi:hypothetical protein